MTEQLNGTPSPEAPEVSDDPMLAIRELLASEEATAAPAPKARKKRKAAQPAPTAPIQPVEAVPHTDRFEEISPPEPQPSARPKWTAKMKAKASAACADVLGRAKARVSGYRPKPKHIVILCAALLVIFRPWLVVGLILLFAFILTAIFLILGYDGFWRRAMGLGRWYARRHPSRSVELHRKLDDFAMKFDAFLDRFPEGTVDGLYLPDLGDLAEADRRHKEALDRRFDTLSKT